MTLPIELLRRRGGAERYDVVVVGGGLAGLACAGTLARRGLRVVVVDRNKRPGGQLQTIAHQGYAIDLGPQPWDARELRQALAAVGVVDAGLAESSAPAAVRVATVDGGRLVHDPAPLPLPGAVTSPATLDAVRALYGVPPRLFAAVGELFGELATVPLGDDDPTPVEIGEWLDARKPDPGLRSAFERSLVLLGASDLRTAAIAAVARRAQWLSGGDAAALCMPGDHPIAGARGLVQAIVDALIDAGGELRLGTSATGMALDRGRFRALAVRREEPPFAEEIAADRCVLALPPRAILELLPAESGAALTPVLDQSRSRASLGVAWAFREAPLSRSGKPGVEPGELRLVRPVASATAGVAGDVRQVSGIGTNGREGSATTLVWASAQSPRVAPPERALLVARVALDARDAADLYHVGLLVTQLATVVGELYRGADTLIEWQRHWVIPDPSPDPFAVALLPQALPGCDGLFAVGASVKTPGEAALGVGRAALSGVRLAERILTAG